MSEKLYDELASWWPRLSPPADYAQEAGTLIELMQAVLPDDGRVPEILELGAGGGHTLVHLAEAGCSVVAVDLSDAMLANCRALIPDMSDAQTIVGDMRTVRLDRVFDVVLIHDAIDYLTTTQDVQTTLATAALHLKPGGLLVVAPTYVTETFDEGGTVTDSNDGLTYVSRVTQVNGGRQVNIGMGVAGNAGGNVVDNMGVDVVGNSPLATQARSQGERKRDGERGGNGECDGERGVGGGCIELTMLMMLHENGTLRVEEDRHVCGLFDESQWQQWITDAGLDLLDLNELPVGEKLNALGGYQPFAAVRR